MANTFRLIHGLFCQRVSLGSLFEIEFMIWGKDYFSVTLNLSPCLNGRKIIGPFWTVDSTSLLNLESITILLKFRAHANNGKRERESLIPVSLVPSGVSLKIEPREIERTHCSHISKYFVSCLSRSGNSLLRTHFEEAQHF